MKISSRYPKPETITSGSVSGQSRRSVHSALRQMPTVLCHLAELMMGWFDGRQNESMSTPISPLSGRRAPIEGATPQRSAEACAALIVAQSGLVVVEEDLADEVAPTMHARLLEHALEVLLDGVC